MQIFTAETEIKTSNTDTRVCCYLYIYSRDVWTVAGVLLFKVCSQWELFAPAPSVGSSLIHDFSHWSHLREQVEIIQ